MPGCRGNRMYIRVSGPCKLYQLESVYQMQEQFLRVLSQNKRFDWVKFNCLFLGFGV